MPGEDEEDNLCIDCSVLSGSKNRKDCEELTRELAERNIDLETFSNALIDKLDGNADMFVSVFCEDKERMPEEKQEETL